MRLLLRLLLNFLNVWFLPLRLLRRHRAAPKSGWIELTISKSPVEVAQERHFWQRGPGPFALETWRQLNRRLADDDRVRGVLVTMKGTHYGSATADALRELIAETRRLGKQVAVYLPEGAGTRELYVASAANQVFLGPETHVTALGFAVEARYLKDAFKKAGIEPEVFARGKYKTAGESLVRTSMSDAQREQVDALLKGAWQALIEGLITGRSVTQEQAEAWVNDGPWTAKEAKKHGIIDHIAYPDEVPKLLDDSSEDGAARIPARAYLRRRGLGFRPLFSQPHIAVVDIKGAIVSKANPLAANRMAVEGDIIEALEEAKKSRRVKGVVVHIDSRGGGALASDRILHEVERLAEKKPVVALMGDAAASGGYMIAVGAHSIVAQPGTLTGSIGVVAARLMFEPLLERVGVVVEVVKRGERADMGSASRPLKEGERDAFERQLEDTYQSFVAAVAKGRKKKSDDIEPLAGGRVWSGRQAFEHGLVDKLGGFDTAMEELRAKLGPGSERYHPRRIGKQRSAPGLGMLGLGMLGLGQEGDLTEQIGPLGTALSMATSSEKVWLWCELESIDLGER